MLITALLCLAGALLELDTTYAFQLTFSRGIIAGPLLGLITGDVVTGLQVGIFTELLFIDIHPLGGLLPPSAVVCCTITLALYQLAIPTYFSFFFGALGAMLFSVGELFLRKKRSFWAIHQEPKIYKNPNYLSWVIVQALLASFLFTFLFTFLFSLSMGTIVAKILPFMTERSHIAGKFAYMSIPWIGLAALVSSFRLKAR